MRFVLPGTNPEHVWELLLDTADDEKPHATFAGGTKYELTDHSTAVFRTRPVKEPDGTSPLRVAAAARAAGGTRGGPLRTEGQP